MSSSRLFKQRDPVVTMLRNQPLIGPAAHDKLIITKKKLTKMHNFLIRAGKSPFVVANAVETLDRKLTLSNTGNLLFQHSIFRAIHSPENNYYAVQDHVFSDDEVLFINENFSAIFLPFANAFRPSWKKFLNNWIENLVRIRIPVVVCGIGAQCVSNDPVSELSNINEEVIKFCSLVLRNSSSIGVRGQFTADYLASLGITDFDVIGCPSLFYFGNTLPANETVHEFSFEKIALTFSPQSPDKISEENPGITHALRLVQDLVESHKNKKFHYFAQETNELAKLIWNSDRLVLETLSRKLGDLPTYYPIDSHMWIENLRRYDLSIGTRLHGCIAGVLSGIPSLLLCHDSRTIEVAKHLDLPHVHQDDISSLDFDKVAALINKSRMHAKFESNYQIFEDFLRKNTQGFLPDFSFYNSLEHYDSIISNIGFPETILSSTYPDSAQLNEKINHLYELHNKK